MRFQIVSILMSLIFIVPAIALETVQGAKKDLATVKQEMAVQLENLEKKIAELKADTAQKSSATKEKTLQELTEASDRLRKEYNELKDSSGEKWQRFKKRFANTLDRLNNKAQSALKD